MLKYIFYYLAVFCCVEVLVELLVCDWDFVNVVNIKLVLNVLFVFIFSIIGLEYEKKIYKIISVINERC